MKKVCLIITIALLIASLPILALARHGRAQCSLGRGLMAFGGMYKAGGVERVLRLKDRLNLTAEQVEKLQAIQDDVQGRCKAAAETLKERRDALRQAIESAASEATIRARAVEIGNAIADNAVLRAAVKTRVDAVITDAQKTQLKQLKEQRLQSRKEWRRGHGDPQAKFTAIDTDADGVISLEEFTAHMEKMRQQRKGRRGPHGPPTIE